MFVWNLTKMLVQLQFHHDGVVDVIDELITKSNISGEIETNIMTDETLNGNGGNNNPLG